MDLRGSCVSAQSHHNIFGLRGNCKVIKVHLVYLILRTLSPCLNLFFFLDKITFFHS